MVQVPVKYQERVGESSVTGSQSKAVKLGLQMIAMCLRMRFAPRSGRYRSDKSEGPTAGTETVDPLEFLARLLVHIPDKGHVTTRYYGWYANRPRGRRRQAEPAPSAPPAIVSAPRLAPTEASRRRTVHVSTVNLTGELTPPPPRVWPQFVPLSKCESRWTSFQGLRPVARGG